MKIPSRYREIAKTKIFHSIMTSMTIYLHSKSKSVQLRDWLNPYEADGF